MKPCGNAVNPGDAEAAASLVAQHLRGVEPVTSLSRNQDTMYNVPADLQRIPRASAPMQGAGG